MTTDPPIAPADLCEFVARLIFDGLPVPVTVSLRPGPPTVLVMPDDLALWVDRTAAAPSAWEPHPERAVEHYRAHADGFDIVSNRPHVCEPVK